LLTGDRSRELFAFHAREHYPMQSVYKLPIGMAVMREVDRGKLRLDAEIRVDKSEYLRPSQYSPLRDQNPNGATVTVRELLRLAISESDGTASDVLLRLIAGPPAVMSYLHDIGVQEMKVLDTEKQLGEDRTVQYRNWATPDGAVELLRALLESRGLSQTSRDLLLRFMTESTRLSARIKGLLPAGTPVAHKPGTSGTYNGVTPATNDIGIITLPDGAKILIAVFVSDSKASDTTRDAVIARIAKQAWDAAAPKRSVAITIDDLPRGGDGGGQKFDDIRRMTTRLLAPFAEQNIPLTGFVHAGVTHLTPAELRQILNLWIDAGANLGNHTYLHSDLNMTLVSRYEHDILRDDAVLRPIVEERGEKLEFFRYPFLHSGTTPQTKQEVQDFLAAHHYRNAPVTFDNSDYMFAFAYLKPQFAERVRSEYVPYLESVVEFFEHRSQEVIGREPAQVLLLHASDLNADMMPQILTMFRRRGYRLVSLDEALRDEAYRLPENYAGPGGFSWIHRWSRAKNLPAQGEPDEPQWVRALFQQAR